MKEIISIVFVLGILAGEFQIISLSTKEKGYSIKKKILIGIYLLATINLPIVGYVWYLIKNNNEIPILSNLLVIYLCGLWLIGVSTIIMDYYKTIKKKQNI